MRNRFGLLALGSSMFALGAAQDRGLTARMDGEDAVVVLRAGDPRPLLVQNAKPAFRPYLHPILAPDGKGDITEFSPAHHRHQTGLYWALTNVNGRDYFHNPGDGFFKRQSVRVLAASGPVVRWEVAYHLLGEDGKPAFLERQTWSMRDGGNYTVLDLLWEGQGIVDVTVGRHDYGGLFLRMPWKEGVVGAAAVNAEGKANGDAEGRRSPWVDVGMPVDGRTDAAHVVIFDHPTNAGHPQPWRIDGQLGVGPCLARLGDWKIGAGKTVAFRHRFLVYTGAPKADLIRKTWAEFVKKGEGR